MRNSGKMLSVLFLVFLCSCPIMAKGSSRALVEMTLPDYEHLKMCGQEKLFGSVTVSKAVYTVTDAGKDDVPITLEATFHMYVNDDEMVPLSLLKEQPHSRLISARDASGPLFVKSDGGHIVVFVKGPGYRRINLVVEYEKKTKITDLLNDVAINGPANVGVVSLNLKVKPIGTALLTGPSGMKTSGRVIDGWKHFQASLSPKESISLTWASPEFAAVDRSAAFVSFGNSANNITGDFAFHVPGSGERSVLLKIGKGLELRQDKVARDLSPNEFILGSEESAFRRYGDYLIVTLTGEQNTLYVPVYYSPRLIRTLPALTCEYLVPLVSAIDCPLLLGLRITGDKRIIKRFVFVPGGTFEEMTGDESAKSLLEKIQKQVSGAPPQLRGLVSSGELVVVRAIENRLSLSPSSVDIAGMHVEVFVTGDGSPPLTHIRYTVDNLNKPELELRELVDGSRIVAAFSDDKRVTPILWRAGTGSWAIPLTFFGKERQRRGIVDLYLRGTPGEVMKFSIYGAWRLPLVSNSTGSTLGRFMDAVQLGNRGQDGYDDGPLGQYGPTASSVAHQNTMQYHRPFFIDVYTPDGALPDITSEVNLQLLPQDVDGAGKKAEGPLPVPSTGKPARWEATLIPGSNMNPKQVVACVLSVSRPIHRRLRGWLLFLGVIALILGSFIQKYEHRLAVLAVGGLSLLLGLLVAPPLDEQAMRTMGAAVFVIIIGYLTFLALSPEEDEDYAS